MAVINPRTWMQHLDPRTCWEYLRNADVGRIGVLIDSVPEIYPVNFVVDDETIVFRTDPGSKLRGLTRSPTVTFEVDDIDVGSRTGWSVLVKGTAEEVSGAEESRHAVALPLEFWAIGDKTHWIRITPFEVTGRQVHRSHPIEES